MNGAGGFYCGSLAQFTNFLKSQYLEGGVALVCSIIINVSLDGGPCES